MAVKGGTKSDLETVLGDPKGISEFLQGHKDGTCFVSCRKAVFSLIGKEKKVCVDKPQTYDCPVLAAWLPQKELKDLVKGLLGLAEKDGKDGGPVVGFISDPVDLDLFYETLVDRLLDADALHTVTGEVKLSGIAHFGDL